MFAAVAKSTGWAKPFPVESFVFIESVALLRRQNISDTHQHAHARALYFMFQLHHLIHLCQYVILFYLIPAYQFFQGACGFFQFPLPVKKRILHLLHFGPNGLLLTIGQVNLLIMAHYQFGGEQIMINTVEFTLLCPCRWYAQTQGGQSGNDDYQIAFHVDLLTDHGCRCNGFVLG